MTERQGPVACWIAWGVALLAFLFGYLRWADTGQCPPTVLAAWAVAIACAVVADRLRRRFSIRAAKAPRHLASAGAAAGASVARGVAWVLACFAGLAVWVGMNDAGLGPWEMRVAAAAFVAVLGLVALSRRLTGQAAPEEARPAAGCMTVAAIPAVLLLVLSTLRIEDWKYVCADCGSQRTVKVRRFLAEGGIRLPFTDECDEVEPSAAYGDWFDAAHPHQWIAGSAIPGGIGALPSRFQYVETSRLLLRYERWPELRESLRAAVDRGQASADDVRLLLRASNLDLLDRLHLDADQRARALGLRRVLEEEFHDRLQEHGLYLAEWAQALR